MAGQGKGKGPRYTTEKKKLWVDRYDSVTNANQNWDEAYNDDERKPTQAQIESFRKVVKKSPSNTNSAVSTNKKSSLTVDEQADFDGYDKTLFLSWIASNRADVWRDYFTPAIKNEVEHKRKDDLIAELRRQIAAQPKAGAN